MEELEYKLKDLREKQVFICTVCYSSIRNVLLFLIL